MKKFFIFLVSMFMIFGIYCGGSGSGDSSGMRLNIIPGNSAFVKSSNNLSQIGNTGATKKNLKAVIKDASEPIVIDAVTTESGSTVTASRVMAVNANYIFLENLTAEDGSLEAGNYILSVATGEITPLSVFPEIAKRITSNNTAAYFATAGSIYEVILETGDATVISSEGLYWTYNSATGYSSTAGSWSSDSWLFISSDNHLYIEMTNVIHDSHPEGMAARFSYSDGAWHEDTAFNQTFYTSMPSYFDDMVPGLSLVMGAWLLTDQKNGKLYYVTIEGSIVCTGGVCTDENPPYYAKIYNYDINTWSKGSLAYSGEISEFPYQTTYLGFNSSIQSGIITTGTMILQLHSENGNISFTETSVPAEVPAADSIVLNETYSSYYGVGAVTNWSFLDDVLYFIDPADANIYSWNMKLPYAKSAPVSDMNNLTFLY